MTRSFPGVLRGTAAIAAILTFVVLFPIFLIFLSNLGAPIPQVLAEVPLLLAMLAILGPGPFEAAMSPAYSGWLHPLMWAALASVFGVLTHRMTSRRRICGLAAAIVFGCLIPMEIIAQRRMAADWRRRPDAALHEVVFGKTPLGSSMEEVRTVVQQEGWELRRFDTQRGFHDQRARPDRVSGAKHIQANLGDYQSLPFTANVTVFWGFDETGRLIDVWVWKTVDGL